MKEDLRIKNAELNTQIKENRSLYEKTSCLRDYMIYWINKDNEETHAKSVKI